MRERIEKAAKRPVSRETFAKLERYVRLLGEEAAQQNLVSRTSLEAVWDRHILDSAQLVRLQPVMSASWLDIGSGAGLPGIVLACITGSRVNMVEPRKRRADFLHRVVEELALTATVTCSKIERVTGKFETITARAVAPLAKLLELSSHLSTGKTVWILPKGRSATDELAEAKRTWQGTFHVEQSVTDADSWIIVGTGVRARA